MTKLNDAIGHFTRWSVENGDRNAEYLAAALEEIREAITPTNPGGQPETTEEQPAFEPWHDVVEITGMTIGGYNGFIGFEGFVTDYDDAHDGIYGIRSSDMDDTYYFPASSLRLVYRLKPRAQEPQPTQAEKEIDRLATFLWTHYQYEIGRGDFTHGESAVDVAIRLLTESITKKIDNPASTSEDLLHAVGYTQKAATFKAGSYVKDIRDDVVYEVMQDSNGPTLQLRDIHTNQPAKCLIRYLVKVEKQTPATFEPWDCVKAKPGSHLEQYTGDAELVLGHRDDDGDWRVFDPDKDSDGLLYCRNDELIFVRRLKPRAQAEPALPRRFESGDRVVTGTGARGRVRWHIVESDRYHILFDDGSEDAIPANELELDMRAEPQPKAPEPRANPVFKMGDRVDWPTGGTIEQGTINHDWENGWYDVTFEYGEKGRIETIHRSHLTFAGKPAPFQVGDWVQDRLLDIEYQVTEVTEDHLMGVDQRGREYCTQVRYASKIDPPAPRFTFGQRVRWSEYPNLVHLFICRYKDDQAQIVDDEGIIEYPYLEDLTLDTSAD